VPGGPTPRARIAALAGALATVVAGGVVLAGPAAAAQDPAAPQVTVLRGPSCDPGGMQFEIVAGDVGYAVRLATTRHPDGEDETRLEPGQRAVLTTDDIGWGETVDPRLEYAALDGSGRTFVDDLDGWTMTRPSRADCAAIAAPPAAPTGAAAASGATGSATEGAAAGSAGSQTRDSTRQPPAAQTTAVVASGAAAEDGASARAVAAGRWITVRGSGFTPGETLTVHLHGRSAVLGRGMAGPDGTGLIALRVPAAASGPTRLDVVGATSRATAGLRLLVAAQRTAADPAAHPFSLPALAALLSLVGAGGAVVAAGRRLRVRSIGSV
jgi:hypothetical protein